MVRKYWGAGRGGRSATADAAARAEQMSLAAREKAGGLAHDAKGRATELSGQARGAAYSIAESGREGAAGALDSAAERLEDRAAAARGVQAATAERAAHGMQTAAGYLKEHETAEAWNDLGQYVRAHRLRSLAVAIAAALVIGRALR